MCSHALQRVEEFDEIPSRGATNSWLLVVPMGQKETEGYSQGNM
jgi:hypothetical protein